jgi:hypothetical protein
MTLDEVRALHPNQPLFICEVHADPDHPGQTITHNVPCRFFKAFGVHVVVILYTNLYLTLFPEEVHKP